MKPQDKPLPWASYSHFTDAETEAREGKVPHCQCGTLTVNDTPGLESRSALPISFLYNTLWPELPFS